MGAESGIGIAVIVWRPWH